MEATDFSNLPQTYMVVCEFDPLRDEGIAYAQKLIDADVPVKLDFKYGATHTFDYISCARMGRFYNKEVGSKTMVYLHSNKEKVEII